MTHEKRLGAKGIEGFSPLCNDYDTSERVSNPPCAECLFSRCSRLSFALDSLASLKVRLVKLLPNMLLNSFQNRLSRKKFTESNRLRRKSLAAFKPALLWFCALSRFDFLLAGISRNHNLLSDRPAQARNRLDSKNYLHAIKTLAIGKKRISITFEKYRNLAK